MVSRVRNVLKREEGIAHLVVLGLLAFGVLVLIYVAQVQPAQDMGRVFNGERPTGFIGRLAEPGR